jgi:hypothetical protein
MVAGSGRRARRPPVAVAATAGASFAGRTPAWAFGAVGVALRRPAPTGTGLHRPRRTGTQPCAQQCSHYHRPTTRPPELDILLITRSAAPRTDATYDGPHAAHRRRQRARTNRAPQLDQYIRQHVWSFDLDPEQSRGRLCGDVRLASPTTPVWDAQRARAAASARARTPSRKRGLSGTACVRTCGRGRSLVFSRLMRVSGSVEAGSAPRGRRRMLPPAGQAQRSSRSRCASSAAWVRSVTCSLSRIRDT